MMTTVANSIPTEIPRLEQEVVLFSLQSRHALDEAMQTAWRIGKMLHEERERLRECGGRRAWTPVVQKKFLASERTAGRYMDLVSAFPDPKRLGVLSLRRIYYYLNITTEPKSRAGALRFRPTPGHVGNANRLLLTLRRKLHNGMLSAENRRLLRQDLAPLHEQLTRLFAEGPRPFRSAA